MKIEDRKGELVITDFAEQEVYQIASKIEKDGIWFYQKVMEKVKNEYAREILKVLIDEEKKHLKLFEEFLSIAREHGSDDNEDNDLLDSMDYGIFQPFQGMPNIGELIVNTDKALKLAVIAEEKSIKFYSACLGKISSKKTIMGLTAVIEEEKKHKALFEKMRLK
ncbi:MAG: hypothetical protein HY810_03815 [Candidatus Omnitrophica bacterium]|nr:hypothetical protein [Candidatus Omnitrophota bacterium]